MSKPTRRSWTALRQGLQDRVRLEFIDAHVNDDSFVDAVVSELRALLEPVHATDVGAGTAG